MSDDLISKEREPIGACALLFNSDTAVLLGERKNAYKAGTLGLPGGHVEPDETVLACIIREVLEETGIQLTQDALTYQGVVREKQEHGTYIHFVFSASVGAAVPQLCEPDKCAGWEWYKLNTLDPKKVLPGHWGALNVFREKKPLIDMGY